MTTKVTPRLTLKDLQDAASGTAAALRVVTRLEPAGGPGDKVFPPTYAGGVYATEHRRINGEVVPCVLLDSVQSQANRMEEALLRAHEAETIKFPLMVVNFAKKEDGTDQDDKEIERIGRITTLDAPHRIADAIFRDSVLREGDGTKPFRESRKGRDFENANIRNATALFDLCPTALIFGTWDSTGSRGGLGNKFARALVSEIIGVNAKFGVRTGSRIDPLGIGKCELYVHKDGGWTVDRDHAKKDDRGNPVKYGPAGENKGKPSAINHGNVTPDFARYTSKEIDGQRPTPDVLKSSLVSLQYSLTSDDGRLATRTALQSDDVPIRAGAIKPGGVTIDYAVQWTVLSLPQLRRLRFPIPGEADDPKNKEQQKRDEALRTVLSALALVAVVYQRESGCDLRSRCLLVPSALPITIEVIRSNADRTTFTLTSEEATEIYKQAVQEAVEAWKPNPVWREKLIEFYPTTRLVDLVRRGREVLAQSEEAAPASAEEGE